MRSLTTFGIFATLLGGVFVGSLFIDDSSMSACPDERSSVWSEDPALHLSEGDEAAAKALQGLWEKRSGDKIRFYYFHTGGVGLYRYGKVGHNYTNSYSYSVNASEIVITFNKTGEKHIVPYEIKNDVITLKKDPREFGQTISYKKRMGPMELESDLALWAAHVSPSVTPSVPLKPQGQMWMNSKRYQNGELAFSIYQFALGAPDGRGAGWHHRGDFSDWSTEGFTYRFNPGDLELRFDLSGETHTSPFRMKQQEKTSVFSLFDDPRNFWHRTDFVHMGKSF